MSQDLYDLSTRITIGVARIVDVENGEYATAGKDFLASLPL
jgi:hypothetical protein